MELLPKALGMRPRLAVDLRPEGIVAAHAADALAVLTAVSRAPLKEGAISPGLRVGSIPDRAEVSAAVRAALDAVQSRGAERSRDVTLVVPDVAVRVLLLDFETLAGKYSESLPLVKFRLKKLLPFDVEDAVVSYQVMSSTRDSVQVMAAAMPREVLQEFESVVSAAGYLPGAVLPSTLATLAGLEEIDAPCLLINASAESVTTAILKGGVLLLHRSVDMRDDASDQPVEVSPGVERIASGSTLADSMTSQQQPRYRATGAEANDIAQAVSVAAAYFEDTLLTPPTTLLVAGTTSAEVIAQILADNGMGELRVRELMNNDILGPGVATATIDKGWLAGVRGALRS